MANTQNEGKPELMVPITAFTLPKTGKSRNKLAQRFDHEVFVNVDLASGWPPNVIKELLEEAITAKCRAAVKKLPPESCTEEDIKAIMAAKVEDLKRGKGVGRKAKPKMDEETKAIRAEARSILRQAFRDQHEASGVDGELDGKALTKRVGNMFKARDHWHRSPGKPITIKSTDGSEVTFDPDTKAKIAKAVDNALNVAAERIKQRTESAEVLGDLAAVLPTKPSKPKTTAPKSGGKGKGKGKPAQAPAR